MKPARRCFLLSRVAALVAVAGHVVSLNAAEKPKREGEKIQFSAPTESSPVKPLTEQDLGRRPFSFQRDELDAQGQLGSPMSSLPSPDQVNRARALQELIERSALLYTQDSDGSLGFEEDPLRPKSADEELGIDELYSGSERNSGGGRDRTALGREGETREGEGRDRNSGERDRDRDRDRLGMRLDDRRGVTRDDNETSSLFRADGSRSGDTEDRFLPTFDLRPRDESERGPLGNRSERDRERDARRGSDGNRDGSRYGFGVRDGVDARRDADGIATFRRMLSTGGRGEAATARGGAAASGNGAGLLGTLGGNGSGGGSGSPLFGATPGATRNLSEALDARGGVATPAADPLDGARAPALPSRPVDLGLNIGRDTGARRTDSGRPEFVPPPRAMELFQRKHDTRLPSRAF